ncbi:MAG: isoamylase early set domain-containing protein [bacterium]
MRRIDDDELPESLRRATELLREAPGVRGEWRRDLQVELDRPPARRWSIRPIVAMAACLVCALTGGVVARFVLPAKMSARAEATNAGSRLAPPVELASNTLLPVRFEFAAPSASRVSIVGDFNRWNPDSLPMRRSADGRRWMIDVRLPAGRYVYGFVVDGVLARDPLAPQSAGDDFGIPNSVLMVSRGGGSS